MEEKRCEEWRKRAKAEPWQQTQERGTFIQAERGGERAEGLVFLYGVCLYDTGKDIRPDHASQKKPCSV